MAKFELKESVQRKSVDFDPVKLKSGIAVNFHMSVNGDKSEFRGKATKADKEVGSASYSTDANRIFLNVFPVSDIGFDDAKELAAVLLDGIITMSKA